MIRPILKIHTCQLSRFFNYTILTPCHNYPCMIVIMKKSSKKLFCVILHDKKMIVPDFKLFSRKTIKVCVSNDHVNKPIKIVVSHDYWVLQTCKNLNLLGTFELYFSVRMSELQEFWSWLMNFYLQEGSCAV